MADFDIAGRVFSYTKRKIEDLVDEFVRRRPYLGPAPPISPDLILTKLPQVNALVVDPVLEPLYGVEAMVLKRFMDNKLTVVIDQRIMDQPDPGPFNMAIAEEIGHIELHPSVILSIEDEDDFVKLQRSDMWQQAEHDAKFFARALLMPGKMLIPAAEAAYAAAVAEHGFIDPSRLIRYVYVQLARTFAIPLADCRRRVETHVGGLQSRLERSIAGKHLTLLPLIDLPREFDADSFRSMVSPLVY